MIFRFKDSMDFFTTIDEALEVAEQSGVPKSDIVCLTNQEYEQLFEGESEISNEEEKRFPINPLSEDDPEYQKIKYQEEGYDEKSAERMVALENYDLIEDDADKKAVLSKALGSSTGKQHNKDFAQPYRTKEVLEKSYSQILKQLNDPNLENCPICSLHISQDSIFEGFNQEIISNLKKENLVEETDNEFAIGGQGWINANKMIKSPRQQLKGVPVPKIIEKHIQVKHKQLFKELKKIFEVPRSQIVKSKLKLATKKIEDLSKDELAQQIEDNPELRREFYRSWIKSLQK